MASSCLGDRKQEQAARFDSHLTGVKKESFLLAHENNRTEQRVSEKVKQICHVETFMPSKLRAL